MVNPFELTIGCYLQWNNQVVQVVELKDNPKTAFKSIAVQTKSGLIIECSKRELFPIPIEGELLKQLGFFQPLERVYQLEGVIVKDGGGFWVLGTRKGINTLIEVKFLHQLQFACLLASRINLRFRHLSHP